MLTTVESNARKQKEQADAALKGLVEAVDAKIAGQEQQRDARGSDGADDNKEKES
ncbi:MAG: hypothetical protein Q6370_011555 [Candidatus Sigynarchaeota archaeon]